MDHHKTSGLIISRTETIGSFLASAAEDPRLSLELRQMSSNLCPETKIPYRAVRNIWVDSDPVTRPELFSLFRGSVVVFNSPKPREKSEELKRRLQKLKEMAERREYEELVKDIAPKKDIEEPFSSYKDQLGFGLHVALTMFTGYLVGYAAFRALFNRNTAMSAAGGILGLVGGMLVETLLFMIKASREDLRHSPTSSKMKKNQ